MLSVKMANVVRMIFFTKEILHKLYFMNRNKEKCNFKNENQI